MKKLAIALLASTALANPAWATQDFNAFIGGRTQASQPLSSGDKYVVIQSATTKYVPGNVIVDTASAQTVTNKTIDGNNNPLTVLISQISGVLTTVKGGTGLGSFTSGSLLCATSASVLASSALLTANLPVIGGGAGVCPASGSVSGNTTKFVTNTGTTPSGQGGSWDANGNWIANSNAAFINAIQTWSAAQTFTTASGSVTTNPNTTYTIQASDCGKLLRNTNAAATTVTTLATMTAGCTIALAQIGTGQVCLANGGSATKHNSNGFNCTSRQWAVIGISVDDNPGGTAANYIITGDGV